MSDVAELMRRCQRGVGGRNALDEAHDIMAECYGTLGRLESERDALRQQLADVFKGNTKLHVLWTEAVQQRDALAAELEGANERARILLDAKNHWAERARKAEAELAAIKGQEPVAFYWQDIGYPEPRKHGPYFGQPSESALRNVDGGAIPVPLYTLPATPEGGGV